MKVWRNLQSYRNLWPYAKGAGLGWLLLVNALRHLAVLLLPATLWTGRLPAAAVLCLCYAVLFVVTNTVSVQTFTKLHIFPRIAMTKKVLRKKAPRLDFQREIEGNVANTRGLVEEGAFGVVLGAVFGLLSLLAALYFAWPVGLCALAGVAFTLLGRQRRPDGEEKTFFEKAFSGREDAERKLAEFSALPRQTMPVYRVDWAVLLRLAAFAAACITGTTAAICSYAYFELALYSGSLFKKGKDNLFWRMHSLEQISAFLKADWPEAPF